MYYQNMLHLIVTIAVLLLGRVLSLWWSHAYFCQVQGQMAITKQKWCDFVIFTNKGISVQIIKFVPNFKLLPKLISFFDNYFAPA